MNLNNNSIQNQTNSVAGEELQKLELHELEELNGGADDGIHKPKSMDENIAEVVDRWNETFGGNFGSIMWL